MSNKEILKWCDNYIKSNDYFIFPDDLFDNLSNDNVESLINQYGSTFLMKMPKDEIEFFEWLKVNDISVWNDLWQSDEEPYIVAMNFITLMKNNICGFPICDLLNNVNYYFTESHLISDESKLMVESVQKMFHEHKQLTIEQALVLEISLEPVDIWRFAYRYNINVTRAKQAVENLVKDKILIHIKDAELLAPFIEL